jgi:pilus assembly protein CpaE
VMAYSRHNDPTLLRQSMEAGSREFLVESLLSETVDEALARALSRRPSRKKDLGKVLVFTPAKGGVGVTTLTANFAMALTRESGARVVVADMDFQLGQIALSLGVNASFSTADALKNANRLDRDFLSTLLVRHSSGLAVLSSPEKYDFAHLSTHEGAGRLFRILREEFDYVVVDTGTYHGHVQEALFEMADKVYLVTELTLPALRNTHRLLSYLADGDRSQALEVVVSRFDSRHADIDENTAMKAMGRSFTWRIPNDYAAARTAQANGVPLATESSPIMKVLVKMARAACGKPVEIEKKAAGRFSFFSSKQLAATREA